MLEFILGLVIGGLLFGFLGFKLGTKEEEKVEKYIRRGIWTNSYTVSNGGISKKSFDVQFELGEIESTKDRSKVEVISMVSSSSEYNDVITHKKLSIMVNNTWMLSSDIDWIDDKSKIRNDKINKILN